MASETAPAENKQKEAALAAYNKIVGSVELSTISLIESRFRVDMAFYDVRNQEKKAAKALTTREFHCSVSTFFYKEETGLIAGKFLWTLDVRKGKKKLLTVRATYLALYKNVPNVGREHALAFLQRVGRFATYPYFRALFSGLAADAQVELPVLPVLK